jgi:trehalose-6-phosphate synthase
MESLAVDRKTFLDLVFAFITHLIKHYKNGKTMFKDTDRDLTTAGMKAKLQQYEKLLIQEPAIVAAYLNLQLLRSTDPTVMG